MGLAIVSEYIFYLIVYFETILAASLGYDIDTTEGLDRTFQEFVGLQTYDELVLLVDVAGLV